MFAQLVHIARGERAIIGNPCGFSGGLRILKLPEEHDRFIGHSRVPRGTVANTGVRHGVADTSARGQQASEREEHREDA